MFRSTRIRNIRRPLQDSAADNEVLPNYRRSQVIPSVVLAVASLPVSIPAVTSHPENPEPILLLVWVFRRYGPPTLDTMRVEVLVEFAEGLYVMQDDDRGLDSLRTVNKVQARTRVT